MDRTDIPDDLRRLPTRSTDRPVRADEGQTAVSGSPGILAGVMTALGQGIFADGCRFSRRGPRRQAVCVHQVLEAG
jgi:hypothetical protein